MVAGVLALGASFTSTAVQATEAETVCTVADDQLTEISGMAFSTLHEGVLWVHNDSGDGPRLYALDTATCEVLATLTIKGIEARDFEAMGTGLDERGRSVIWIADIGDNTAERKKVYLHRLPEPADLSDQNVTAATFAVRYDRPADAEAILIDDSAVWIITKGLAAGTVEQLALPLPGNGPHRTETVGAEEGLVTDAAMSPGGDRYVVRDYTEARIYGGPPPGELVTRLPLPDQIQGEAVAWTPDGLALVIASENDDRILRVALPAVATSPPAPDVSDIDGAATTEEPASEGNGVATPSVSESAPESSSADPTSTGTDDTALAAPKKVSTVLDPAEQLGSLSLLAIAISGGVFLIASVAVIIVVVVRDRRRTT